MIYLDQAATTKVCDEAKEAMEPFLRDLYGNPSSLYELGETAKEAVEESRRIIAKAIHCTPEHIFFTSGGTESDNWVLEQAFLKGRPIFTSTIEHHAILNKCRQIQSRGGDVCYLPTDSKGVIQLKLLEENIVSGTSLVSVMFANNEVGTMEPVEEIGNIAKKKHCEFHTDAVQAFCHVPIDVERMGIDYLSASGHKIHGPKGVGFLYVRNYQNFLPMIYGGEQEQGRRPGTENVPGIVGMGAAVKVQMKNLSEKIHREERLRNYLANRILREIPGCTVNGSASRRLPGNLNLSIAGIEGAAMVTLMSDDEICISAGSACASGQAGPSHVLKALGQSDEQAYRAIRLTLDYTNTKEEIDRTVECLKRNVNRFRRGSR
ncbi:MAG: cysteine desulfurase [Eubacterium sp.]|nr:cysteine desulfurase [Eubacterium sp.]